ncbi:MAG: hypothetical protein IT337_14425 [Thermomicrobiales bacterium]|nr:hypothetical protein [Thermomicrobiales bacterium]
MAERIRALLEYIVNHYAVVDEQKDVDLNAKAAEGGDAIRDEKGKVDAREWERAAALAGPFVHGLEAAYQARLRGDDALALDDRYPDQNAQADALITFLVSFDLAESRTDETEPGHYRYTIAVNWDALAQVAHAAGLDLFDVLAEASK